MHAKYIDRQADRQIGRQTGIHTYTKTLVFTSCALAGSGSDRWGHYSQRVLRSMSAFRGKHEDMANRWGAGEVWQTTTSIKVIFSSNLSSSHS